MFRPRSQVDLAPAGTRAKLAANVAALRVLRELDNDGRWADPEEQRVLARWSGWGAIPQVFDETDDRFAAERDELRLLLDDVAWQAARRTTLNAHYTDAAVVTAMWQAVADLGFVSGLVLEPGCGSGNFVGFAPDTAAVTGIELDVTTARIARHLYGGRAQIHASPFERFEPSERFDLVIGNVPFADVVPHDPRRNRSRHRLHNYFLIKSLQLTRPGGAVAALTSRYTLDARNPAARREMNALADLIGAIRLPSGAFAASAGTDVVVDLLLFRRREPGLPAAAAAWTNTAGFDDHPTDPLWCNEYFLANPHLVAGRLGVGRGMYRERELTVESEGELVEQLTAALRLVTQAAASSGLRISQTKEFGLSAPARSVPVAALPDGSFVLDGHRFGRVVDGRVEPYAPRARSDVPELRALIGVRDAARRVLEVQAGARDDAEVATAQSTLAERYDAYVGRYGPLNRYKLARAGRQDPETGEEVRRRIRPRMGGFRDDPDWPLVAALEIFDDETQAAHKAPIFTARVISPPIERLGVDTAAEAIAVCMDVDGEVTLPRASELLGVSGDEARLLLADLVWDDPETGRLIPAAEYLSGNVRRKLAAAQDAADRDPRFLRNLTALRSTLPRQLDPPDITARMGAPWIPSSDVEKFCGDVLGAEVEVEFLPTVGRWAVALRVGRRGSVSLSSEWGTARADAVTLLDASLNQRLHTVTDETEDGRRVRNDAETIAAREKQDALGNRFSEWVWEDPVRAERLAARYNELFSSVVLPEHDGSHLTLPGLADTFTPRRHQRDAVARILTDGRALLAHAVGAGKTATMVIAAMELRRLGAVSKPAVIVPNHMLDQFTREWLQLYPRARLLVADRDRLSADRRREFVARCATGQWDGVLFTHSGFGRVPLRPETSAAYLGAELDRARVALDVSRNGKGLSVKRLERRIAQLEETYQRLLAEDRKDDGVSFEETGIDYLFVDESHLFKNRRVDSSIDGMGHAGSQRAQDLDAKLWALRQRHGERVVTFATATPVANSMAELWVMQTYLQPDVLTDLDLAPFDAWAATFGRTVTSLELAPDGASYRLHTRFARFQNVPELMTIYRQVADVRTHEQLDLPTPALMGGAPQTVVVPASDSLRDFVVDLAGRAERVRNRSVHPTEDNMLKISGDGRRAALDLRLVGLLHGTAEGKIEVAAERIASIHHATRDRRYVDEAGEPHPRPGALQLVFCDASTPAGDGWNAYDELRSRLAEHGVPPDAVCFVHDAPTDDTKAKLFQACRDGRVAVLVGSTEKMGVGTNVQARAVALHHLDCPWRPADIEQRDGRIARQGNQNAEVEVIRYVTEGSFDTYMWQTLERKAAFISQVTRGDLPDRDVDDIGDQALSYAEVKALATGNPLILEKAGVDNDVSRLRRLERAHQDDQHRLRRALESARQRSSRAAHRVELLTAALARRRETRGDRFTMQLDGSHFAKRTEAGTQLRFVLGRELKCTPRGSVSAPLVVGELAGFPLTVTADRRIDDGVRLNLGDVIEVSIAASEITNSDAGGLIQRLERRVGGLESALAESTADVEEATREAERARSRVGRPFEHAPELARLLRRQAALNEALMPTSDDVPVSSPTVAPVNRGSGLGLA